MTADWRGPVDQLLYSVMFDSVLDDAVVARTARTVLDGRSLTAGPGAYVDAIGAALSSDARLAESFDTPHDEAAFRDFLGRLRHRLEQLRPWPEPAYVRLPVEQWLTFGAARPVAQLGQSLMAVQDRLAQRFERLPGDDGRYGLLLRLNSGHTVAVVGSYQPGPVTLLQRGPGDPATVIAAFQAATGLDRSLIVPTP
ncbi:hypothetical protein [Micromonospora rubida]|uniref:hypothetical protein n=1 Tax=Micromonospora rubida TaxID=2697657 RepID=UPI0013778183|nr:hypothetical protein [Micromonospora rubida]NBE80767.1 hypothetical protein [Micromonospora rubida]